MTYEMINKHDSPNYWAPADLAGYATISIDSLTIHHWGNPDDKPTFAGTVDWLCRANGNSSAHEVIEAGKVAQLINFGCAAWHSGTFEGNTKSYSLELNPRASDGDYATAAERIADIWKTHGRKPLRPHKSWKATECPGRWDLTRLERQAAALYSAAHLAPVPPSAPAKPPAPATAAATGRVWVVDPGDTLGTIAAYYGLPVHVIATANKVMNPDRIKVGARLRIPAGGSRRWFVDKGDTLGGIAAHYRISVESIALANGIKDPDKLRAGMELQIP